MLFLGGLATMFQKKSGFFPISNNLLNNGDQNQPLEKVTDCPTYLKETNDKYRDFLSRHNRLVGEIRRRENG